MRYDIKGLVLGILCFSSIIWARGFSSDGLDSLDRLPPNLRYYYMQKNFPNEAKEFLRTDSQGIRMVGKWGRGPSSRVTGRDSLVFLSLGSEVAIINMSNPSNPQVVYEVQARGGVAKSVLKDSFLFIGGPGIEIWNIINPSRPIFRNRIETSVSDFCIRDSFLYDVAGDSFRIFNITNISNPVRVGICDVSGYYLSLSGNYAYVSNDGGLYIINIQNPTNPYQVNSWGGAILSAQTRDTFCYVSTYDPMNPDWLRFTILNVANPNSIQEASHIDMAGGYDIYLLNYFAYISGYYLPVGEFQIIDISNASFPTVVSRCTTAGWNNGVWVNNPFGNAFVADDWEGLQVIDMSNPTNPHTDTSLLKAHYSYDLVVDRNYVYIANFACGLKIIDVINPTLPLEIGQYDTVGRLPNLKTVVAKDSFAFIPRWWSLDFRSIDVSDPCNPRFAGIAPGIANYGEDMVIRDSFVYVAYDYHFGIFNIANPRQPWLVGQCSAPDGAYGLCIRDGLAYFASLYSLTIINISQPNNPTIIGVIPIEAWGVALKDTFAFVASASAGIKIISIANPQVPYLLTTFPINGGAYDVVANDTILYVAGTGIKILNISNPINPSIVVYYDMPFGVRRIFFASPYIYTACMSSGISIFEQLPSAIDEFTYNNSIENSNFIILPNPANTLLTIRLSKMSLPYLKVSVFNVVGKKVKDKIFKCETSNMSSIYDIDISDLPPGVFLVTISNKNIVKTEKLIKIRR